MAKKIYHAVGAGPHFLKAPVSGDVNTQFAKPSRIVIVAEDEAAFRVQEGNNPALTADAPTADVTDGAGSLLVSGGYAGRVSLYCAAGFELTAVSAGASDVLTYWFE